MIDNNKDSSLYKAEDKAVMKLAEDAMDRKADRVAEIIAYCKTAGIKKVGIAHCVAVNNEAENFSNILTANGFQVASVNCKFGKVPFNEIVPDYKGVACNPAGQANYLAENNTELNVMMGLCLGHDMIFNKHSKALVTPLIVKDRKLKHKTIEVLNKA